MKLIINCETGEETLRELNKAEKDQQKIDEAEIVAENAEAEAKTAQRQLILDKLGLTADEAQLLLG
jgi:hypothetical protein